MQDDFMSNPVRQLKLFWIRQIVYIAGALLWMILTPSEDRSGLLNLSTGRLALSGLILILLLVVLGCFIWLAHSPQRLIRFQQTIHNRLIKQKWLVPVLLFLLITTVVLIAFVAKILTTPLSYREYENWAPTTFPLLFALTQRLLPIFALLIAFCVDAAVFLVLGYRREIQTRAYWSWPVLGPALAAYLLVLVTLVHWIMLAFQIRLFANHPAWYWTLQYKPFTVNDMFYFAVVALLMGLAGWLIVQRKLTGLALAAIFAASIWLQMGTGLLAGGGLTAFGERYFNTYHVSYPRQASRNDLPMLENIRRYEEIVEWSRFTRTKPPGLMVFYLSLERLINGRPDESDRPDELRLQRLSRGIIFIFPVMAAAMVFLLFAFLHKGVHLDKQVSAWVPYFLILCPSLVLLALFADQAIYPILFLVGFWLIIIVFNRQSIWLAFLLGAALFAFSFFAFTMLPLFPLAGIYLLLHWLQDYRSSSFISQVKLGVSFLLGVAAAYVLFNRLFNYDFLERFGEAMQINHTFDFYQRVGLPVPSAPETLAVRIQQTLGALWINNLEFATVVGLLFYLLFIVYGIRIISRFMRRTAQPDDAVFGSLFLAYIVMNLGGTVQGEVGRLWIFWTPMVVIFAVLELYPWIQKKPVIVLAATFLQLCTLMLTYHFQDLLM